MNSIATIPLNESASRYQKRSGCSLSAGMKKRASEVGSDALSGLACVGLCANQKRQFALRRQSRPGSRMELRWVR